MNNTLIYHFILDYRIGGNHIYVDTLKNALSEAYQSKIVTNGRGGMTDIALINIRHLWRPLYFLELLINAFLILILCLFGKIPRHNILFHVHGGASLSPIFSALLLRIPVIWTIHETIPVYSPLVSVGLYLLKFCNHRLIVVANASKDYYPGLLGAQCIPSAIDINFWSRDQVSGSESSFAWRNSIQPLKGEPIRFLAVGNINPIKGFDLLIKTLSEFREPWTLKIVGSPLDTHEDYYLKLKNLANKVMLERNDCLINFLGWQNNIQIRALLAGCDIFVLTSVSEACPICLLEAMSMRCYCLAANVGDVVDILKLYKASRVFIPNDANKFLSCLEGVDMTWLRAHPQGEGEPPYDISPYSRSAMANSYERVYRDLMQEKVNPITII